MSKTGISNSLRFAIIGAQLLFLCACNMTSPSNHASQSGPGKQTAPSTNSSLASPEGDHIFSEQQLIVPSQGIDKDGLLISYSMKVLPDETGYLLQLTLVFRNMNAKNITVKPKVALLDDKGANIAVYTKKSFDKVAARVIAKARHKGASANAVKEQLEWDKAFWLKSNFKIPDGGIQIGGLVFHSTNLNVPMTLIVSSQGKVFQFIIKDPVPSTAK